MKKETVPIKSIFPNDDNPRILTEDRFHRLIKMVSDFPKMLEIRPIVIDENRTILSGNMRYRACQKLKFKTVTVVYADDLTESEKQEFIVKDNLPYGEWDWGKINMMFDSEELLEFGFFEDEMNIIEDGFVGRKDDAPQTVDKSDTLFSFGEVRFRVNRKEYENWINNLRINVGFDDISVENTIRKKLKI